MLSFPQNLQDWNQILRLAQQAYSLQVSRPQLLMCPAVVMMVM